MGNSNKDIQENKFESSHPNLKDAKIITDKGHRYIQAPFKAQAPQYEDWNKHFQGYGKLSSNFLLLPDKAEFKDDKGLCGNTGTLTVPLPLPRTNIPSTPTSSQI